MIFAYFGPDTLLPVTSIIATVFGVFLMFGRRTFQFLKYGVRAWFPGASRVSRPTTPHARRKESARPPSQPSA